MALPLVSTPQLLTPDDVFGVALANRTIERHADIVRHLGVEHTIGASGAGEHNSAQIAKAVCVYTPPKYRTDGNTNPDVFDLVTAGPTVAGFLEAPKWRVQYQGATGVAFYFVDFVVDGELLGFTHHAFMDASPTYTADMLSTIKARCEIVTPIRRGDPNGAGRVWLGNRTAINKFQKGLIVAHVAKG